MDLDQDHVNRLTQVAIQLAARVRDEGPEDNGEWLQKVLPDPADWFRLTFVLAAAVPEDQPWSQLTGWIRGEHDVVDPNTLAHETCGTPAGARRHWRRGEPACPPCRAAENRRNELRRAARRNRLETAA